VYQAIKAMVIACEFPQGKRIYLDPLATQLGVSTTPVREGLIRLVAEGLVIQAPRKGFIAMTLSEDTLRSQYELTRLLLTQTLKMLDETTRRELPKHEALASVLNRLNRRELSDVKVLASYTGEIFAHIAALTGNAHVIDAIGTTNDRLFFLRTRECQHFGDVQDDLKYFCELLLSGQCEMLKTALNHYHNQRIALLPTLFPTLR
jgi:DNA-binding GntR family transcriptional regulator